MPHTPRIRRPSPALCVAVLALILALGGTSYAAITVTGAQIKDGSITSRDIRNRTLRAEDFRQQLAAGRQGAQGAKGDVGPAAPRSEPAVTGTATGAAGAAPSSTALSSGEVLAGAFEVRGQAVQAGDMFRTVLPFGHRLPARPTAVRLIKPGDTVADCQGWGGNPDPAPGVLCIFVDGTGNDPEVRINFAGGSDIVLLTGTGVAIRATRPGETHAFGGWAYKVP